MPKRKTDLITFIAEYEDGSKDFFQIDRFTLRNGDGIAGVIAQEWQDGGRLKRGEITRAYRAPIDQQFMGPILGLTPKKD